MSLIKKILNNSFWLLVGNSIGRLSMFLANIVAARLLSQETFGQFMMIRNTISTIEGLVSGSLGSPMITRIAEVSHSRSQDVKRVVSVFFILNIAITLILASIFFFSSPWLVKYFFIDEIHLRYGFYIGSFLIVTTILSSLMQSLLIGFEQYKKIAFSGFISSIISFPMIFILIYYFELYGAIIAVTTYFAIDFIVKYIQFKKLNIGEIHIVNYEKIIYESKYLLNSSKYLFLSTLITSIGFWYARVLIVNKTNSFENIAIFDAAFQWLSIVVIITGATTNVALPMMSKVMNNKENKNKIFYTNMAVNVFIVICSTTILIVFSKSIMSLYGESYIKGQTTLIILAITSIFFTLYGLYNKWMISHQETKSILFSSIISMSMLFIVLLLSSYNATITLALSFGIFYFVNYMILFLYRVLLLNRDSKVNV
ncbi:MAG: oligosaccharide flippase family protein [Bacteroidales bacterium]|nr:oligosaccharide flippase family protein [Bacteroidales bacterium]